MSFLTIRRLGVLASFIAVPAFGRSRCGRCLRSWQGASRCKMPGPRSRRSVSIPNQPWPGSPRIRRRPLDDCNGAAVAADAA